MSYIVKDALDRVLICRKCAQPLVTGYDFIKCGCTVYDSIYVMEEDKMLELKKSMPKIKKKSKNINNGGKENE